MHHGTYIKNNYVNVMICFKKASQRWLQCYAHLPNHFSARLDFRKVCLCNSASLITEMKNVNFCLLISAETNHFLVINVASLI